MFPQLAETKQKGLLNKYLPYNNNELVSYSGSGT